MSAMAAEEPPPRLDSVLSFGNAQPGDDHRPAEEEPDALAFSDDDDEDAGFEFAFAPPLGGSPGSAPDLAPADDLFAHGRLVPAYPVFDRHLLLDRDDDEAAPASAAPQGASTAPPSPDIYCAWAPRSAPGSPAREFPKSASTGESSSRRFRGLHGLFSGAGRSHSDGKEKFLFLQPAAAAPSKMSGSKAEATAAKPSSSPAQQKQSKRKGGKAAAAGAVTEMDMATAHKLFYGKPGAGALAGDRKHQPQQSFLPYRPGIVGFFTAAHALGGRSHHPY